MALWNKLRFRLRALFFKQQLEEELAEEIRQHLERRTQTQIAAGDDPTEARYAALRQFGGVEQIKEEARDARGVSWIEEFFQDIVYGARLLRRAPGFAAVAILTLALGIGATTAIFSVVRGVLLRPLNYPEPQQLMAVRERLLPRFPQAGVSPGAYFTWKQRTDLFEHITAWDYSFYTLTGLDTPQRRFALRVTPNFLATYGIAPSLGRDFRDDDEKPAQSNVAILGYGLWLSEFGGSPDAIGRTIRLDNTPYTIIGVAPEWFPPANYTIDLFIPKVYGPGEPENFAGHYLDVVARLKANVSLSQAQAAMTEVAAAFAQNFPATNKGWTVTLTPLLEDTVSGWRSELFTLLGAVGLLLLIACVNVANLLLARASSRQREIAVRAALGAGRARILRQLLAESVLLGTLGGLLGIGFAFLSMKVLLTIAPNWLPRVDDISIDGAVLAFTWLLSVLTGIAFGLVPAIHASQVNLNENLKNRGPHPHSRHRRHRLSRGLIVAEVALATTLLFAAGLLIRSLRELEHVDPGFQPNDVYYMGFNLSPERFPAKPDQVAFVDRFIDLLASLPGMDSATMISRFTRTGASASNGPVLSDLEQSRVVACSITPAYFKVLSIPLVEGRAFTRQDNTDAPRVAVIDTEFARKFFPGQSPLGQRLKLNTEPDVWQEIVGVVGHVKPALGEKTPVPQVYQPFAQNPDSSLSLYVHSSRARLNLATAIRSTVTAVEKGMAVGYLHYLPNSLHASLKVQSYFAFIFGVFSGAALLLAATGVYGVMAYVVNQRTSEIGLRTAFGAQRGDIVRLIFIDAAKLVGLGLFLGLAGAAAVSRLISFMLFNVTPYDPVTLVVVVVVLAGTALLACWIPIWRATRVEPMAALRSE